MKLGDRVRLLDTNRIGTYIGAPSVFGTNITVSWHDTGERTPVRQSDVQIVQPQGLDFNIGDHVRCVHQPEWGVGSVKSVNGSMSVNVLWDKFDTIVRVSTSGLYVLPTHTETDCRSNVGITVGLIDSLITMSRVLRTHDFTAPEVKEALKDLQNDHDLKYLLLPELVGERGERG